MPPKAKEKAKPKAKAKAKNQKSPEQVKRIAERSKLWKAYDIKIREYVAGLSGWEGKARWLLASRWQQWCRENSCDKTAQIVNWGAPAETRKQQLNLWFSAGSDEDGNNFKLHQVTLSLLRDDTYMNDMVATLNTHPLAVGSDDTSSTHLKDQRRSATSSTFVHSRNALIEHKLLLERQRSRVLQEEERGPAVGGSGGSSGDGAAARGVQKTRAVGNIIRKV